MVQVIDTGGSIAGRIGKGFGKGLSEQVPKEIERYRLSEGLKSLGEQGQSLSPYQQAAKLYGTAGVTPEMANRLIPLLQEQNAIREAAARQQSTQPQQGIGQPSTSPQLPSQPTSAPDQGGLRGIVTPESTAALQKAIIRSTPEQLRNRGSQLNQQFPAQFPNLQAGIAEAKTEDDTRIANEESKLSQASRQNEVRRDLQNEFKDRLNVKLQKNGTETYADILGDAQTRLMDRAEDEVARGKLTAKEAGEKYGKIALDFAKSRQNLKTMGSKSWFSKTPSGTKKSIDAIRDEYKKIGELESFEKDLESYHGLTPYYASYLAYPVKNNKEINNSLSSLKPKNIKDIREGKQIREAELADKIGKNLTDNDSILSIALALHGKGYDESAFLDQLDKDRKNKKITITETQARELQNRQKVDPSLGDLFLFAFSGLDKFVEQQ